VVLLYVYMPRGQSPYGCKLYLTQKAGQPGVFEGFLLYAETSGGEPTPVIKKFTDPKGEKELLAEAESWIRQNLFEDYERTLAQMLDEIPHGVV
jgi:hypothetical protein